MAQIREARAVAAAPSLRDANQNGEAPYTEPLKPAQAKTKRRRIGDTWIEGRHLCRCGPTGITSFDIYIWLGEPRPLRVGRGV
jgi:hypothetical protein